MFYLYVLQEFKKKPLFDNAKSSKRNFTKILFELIFHTGKYDQLFALMTQIQLCKKLLLLVSITVCFSSELFWWDKWGRGHKRLWVDIHISITRRRVKVQKAYTMLQIDVWFCSWHLSSMMWSLKGSQKTDKQSWSESLRQRNNGKNDVLMWWTNKTDVSSCVCVIVSVLRGRSQIRE